MARLGWWVLVLAAVTGCGGVELDARRHDDGTGGRDGGSSRRPGNSLDAGNAAADASPRGCALAAATVDWSSPLSCDGLDGCTVSGVKLADGPGAQAYGIASSADGTKTNVWERRIDPSGGVVETKLPSFISDSSSEPAKVDTVQVYAVPQQGLVLGLSGIAVSDDAFRLDWAAIPSESALPFGGSSFHSAALRLEALVMTRDSGSFVHGITDAHGNFLWGAFAGSWASGLAALPARNGVILAVDQGGHEVHWYETRTDVAAFSSDPPAPDYGRSSDFVTVGVAGSGTVDLPVHSIVRMRANADDAVLIAGVLRSGALDVRRLTSDGATSWAASPLVDAPDSLCIAHDGHGGGVVAWNVTPTDRSGPHIVLQRFALDGSCKEQRLPGTATDVLVRSDDRIVLATDAAIVQLSP